MKGVRTYITLDPFETRLLERIGVNKAMCRAEVARRMVQSIIREHLMNDPDLRVYDEQIRREWREHGTI